MSKLRRMMSRFHRSTLPQSAKQRKVHKVLSEFKEGTLRSSSGAKVTGRRQAVAIAMSEAGLSRKKRKKRKKRV